MIACGTVMGFEICASLALRACMQPDGCSGCQHSDG